MARLSAHLLQQIGRHIARVPATPEDLATIAAQLAPQLQALARLDDLDLLAIEPAIVLPPLFPEPRAHG